MFITIHDVDILIILAAIVIRIIYKAIKNNRR